jgi:hypothetical protein
MKMETRKLEHLRKEHYELILSIRDGADIVGAKEARLLREIEATEPAFIHICGVQKEYDGAGHLPYFGAIATSTGIIFAKRRLESITAQNKQGE